MSFSKSSKITNVGKYVKFIQIFSPALREKLINKLSSVSGKSIILHEKQDKTILGGIVLRYGNTEIDSSVKSKLDKIRSQIDSAIV